MYKAGKHWLFASIAAASFGLFAATEGQSVHADVTSTRQTSVNSTTSQTENQSTSVKELLVASQSTSAVTGASESTTASQSTSISQSNSQSTSVSLSTSASQSTSTVASQSTSASQEGLSLRLGDDAQTSSSQSNSATIPSDSNTDRSGVLNTTVPSKNSNTSVTVNVPDQVQNPDNYKENPVNVSTYSEFMQAWSNPTVDYINVTKDITNDGSGQQNRPSSTGSVIINGNGHTLDLGGDQLYMGTLGNSSQNATLTMTNVHLENGYSDSSTNNGTNETFLYTDDGSHLTINVNNVSLSASQLTGNDPAKFVYTGVNSALIFSGTNVLNNTNEIARGATNIQFANNSKLIQQRPENDFGNAAFWLLNIAAAGTTGYGNSFTIGDGATLDMEHYSNTSGSGNNVNLIYQGSYLNGISAGDNVSWTQKGFRGFFSGANGSANSQFIFGKNFNLNIPSTDATASLTLMYLNRNQSMVFNAGSQINIQTNYASDAMFWVDGSSTVTFNSPKSIHFARLNASGTAGSPTTNFFYGVGPVTITNGTTKVWTSNDSSANNPNGNGQESFAKYVLTGSYGIGANGATTLTRVDGTTVINPSDLSSGNIREMQTQSIGVGQVYVQYKDQYGNNVGSPVLVTLPSDAYIGQYIALTNNDIINTNMPSNYIWALGHQIPASAKADAQSQGSPDTVDNGDDCGQANIAVIPVMGTSYTYNVYVYGVPETVTYQYVDVNNANNVLTPKSTTVQPPVLANYGNVINWADSYYTNTTVPDGYSYVTGYSGQPSTTTVGTANNVVKIYVQGNWQTATESYQDLNGNTVTPNDQVTLTGRTGQVVTIPNGPATDYYALDRILVNGQTVTAGSDYTITNGSNLLTYIYRSLDGEKDSAKAAIDNAAQAAIQKINGVTNLTADQITAAVKAVQENQDNTKSAITAAKSESDITTNLNSGLLNMSRNAASLVIDGSAQEQNDAIAALKFLSADQKAKYEQAVTDDANALKADLNSNAANPSDVQAKQDAATTKLSGDESKAELDDYGTNILNQIKQMPALTDQQKADAATAVQGIVGNGQNLIGVKTMLSDIMTALQASKASLNDEKNKAQGESDAAMTQIRKDYVDMLEQYVVQADAQIDSLTLIDKDAAKETVRQTADAAKAKINSAADQVSVINAEGNGEVAIAKNTADSTIDNATFAAENKVLALNNLQSGDKAAAKTNIESLQTSAKNNIASALHTTDVTTALTNGTNLIAQKASATVIQDAVAGTDSAIDALKTMSATEKQSFKDKITSDATTYSNNLTAATNGSDIQTVENNGVAVIQADIASAVLKDYQENADNQLDAFALNATNAVSALPNLDKSTYLANIATDVKNGKAAIDGASSSSSVDDALGTAKRSIDCEQAAATLKSAQNVANAAVNAAAQSVNAVIGNLKPLDPAEIIKYQDQVNDVVTNATTQINGEPLPATVSSNQASAISKINGIRDAASLQNAKEAVIAVAKQAAADAKTTISNFKSLKPEEVTKYQGQVDVALQAVTSQINSETTTDAVTSDQTTFTNTTLPNMTSAANLQNAKEDDNAQLDSYAQNAKNNIADKTVMPDLTLDQISDYSKQVDTAVLTCKSSINGGQDTTTVAANFQAAKDSIDKIKATAQAESDVIVSQAKSDADNAIDQSVTAAQADVQKLSPLSDQAARLAAIKNDGDAAKAKIAADKNTADISSDQVAGLQAITDDKNAAILQSAKEGAIAAVTKINQGVKTTIGNMKPLDSKEILTYQNQVDGVLTAATTQINKETTVSSVTSDQTSFTSQINGIQDTATLQNTKENDNNQLGQYAQSVKNAIADKTGMPDLTPDQISDYDKQIDTAVLTGKSSINDGQDTTTVATNFQTTKDNIDKIQAAAQAQSTATVSAARGAANTAIDQAVANVQATVQKLDPLKDQAARLAAIKSNGDSAKAKIAADANTASINADRDAGLNTIQADQNAATLESAKEEAIAVTTQAVIDAKTAISNLKPLKPEEVTEYQGQADTALQAVTNQINSETTTDAVTSDQTTFTNTTLPNIKNAASLQNAKDAAIAVATQNATDAKTAIGGLKSLQPDEITNYQGQVDSALSDATTQINQETTIAAVLSDQDGATTKISGIQNAAELQNTKENDNTQLDQYAQNAKNAIADKTGMPDLTPEQISDYDNQIDTAVSTGKSSTNGGQDTTTVATNFQTAKNNIDKIQAKAQAHSNAIVSAARDAANNAIDQAVMTAQAAVQKLDPLKDQATRLAQIQKDGNSAKAKIAADANTASIIADRDTGLNTIQADRDAATLESAREAAIATVTQAAAATKTAIGALQPLQPSEIKNFQDQVDGAVTAATSQINSETTTDAVASDQANAIINTIAGIQTAASLQSIKEKDNAQLLQDGQTAKNKIAAMPDLTKDQIAQANSDIDSAVSNGQTAITGSQNEADVETNFQTAESNINKVTATAQSQSDNTVANAKTAAGDVLDKAATAAKAAIDQLPVLKADEKADFKSKIDAAVTAAKNSIQNDTTVAAVTADQNNGLTAISSQQAAATLQNAKEDSINQLTAYAQGGRTALTKLPNLTDAQADQANTSITSAVTNGTTSINAARDLAGVTRALVSAESAVNRAGVIAVNQSNAALVSARTAAEAAINAVAAAVKTTINNLSPLSDQQARLSQVDTDIVNAKTALESTSATADVTAAQGKAIARLNADVANAQQKSSQEDTISRLRNYATNAETAIAEMPALSADNLTTAKAAIESAVANGDSNIQGASEHAAMANVLIAAEQAIDAAATIAQNQSQQILAQAQSDASAAIDAALIVAQQKLNNLSLSADDQAAQEKQLENDAGSAKININAATSLAAVTQAQQTGAQTINQDILSAEIVSLQTEAKKRLQAYADQTKQTISSLHDLPSDSYTNAYKGVDALVKIWSGNIVNTRNLADMQSALYSGATAINLVSLSAQANSQKVLDQERAAAETAINQAAATARQTINDLSPLSDKSARLDQIDQDVKDADDALDAATNNQGFIAAQNAGTATITTHVTAAQLKSAQEQADADLATYGQNIYAQIAALPDLTATQRQQASTDITNAVSQGKTAIDATTSQSDVAPAFATAEKVINGIQEAAQGNNQTAVKQSQSAAGAIIDVAAKAAKATVDNLSPLSDKQDREAQIDTDAKNAKDEIAKATTKADVTAAQNAGTTTITNDTTAAQLQSAQEQADADLATYGQNAKNAIKAMPDLSDDQRKQANDDIDAAVSADQTQQINAATDANGVATALVAGKSAVDKVQATAQSQSDAAVQQDRDDADDTIDAAVKQAKATINSLNPLSDKAKRLAQVDTDADSAKNAVAQANNKTDITTAQNAGIATITQDAADAQLKSTKETNDATLAAYGQTAKDAIAKMPDLTTAQIDQANKDVDAAILAGQGQIDVAPDAGAAATALTNGEKAVDAVQAGTQNTSNTTVQQERDAAAVAIDAAVKNANDAIEGMKPLADTATPEGNVAAAAQVAKDAIAKAGNKTAIMAAQNSGTAAITNETTAAQLQSTKEATIATLTQTAQAAKDAIKVMPDLNTDQIAAANAAVDAAFNDGQSKINAATDDDGVSTALTNGETGIKNAQAAAQAESDAIVAQERSAAKAAIDTAAQQATDKIDAMTPLSDKQSREDQVAKDAQNAKTAIDQAKNKVAITAAQTSGTDAINNEVAAAQLQSTKETDNNTLTADGHTTKDAIGKMPDLTPDQVTAFDSQIDAAMKAAQGQIDAARDANSVATAFATGETNIQNIQQDAQNTSDAKVASERLTANNAIDAAMKAAKTAIEGMNPLADKTTPESQVDAAAQAAKAAIAGAKKQTDITDAQNSGTDAIDKVTAGAQLQSKKEAAKATLVQHGADAKAAIAAVPDLTDDQRKQANSAIDAAVKTGQGNIDGAADAAGVGTALQNGEAAVDAVTATAKTNSATTVANEKKTASDAIDAAAAKAKAAIDGLNPLSDKADREAQVEKNAAVAKTAINNATNQADITTAQKVGTDQLDTDTANAQLKNTKETADAALAQHGAYVKAAIAKRPDLTDDQRKQANSDVDAAVSAGQTNIDSTIDATGVANALTDGKANVDKVQASAQAESDAAVQQERNDADAAIDAAVQYAKTIVDGLAPLSDKAARDAQIDADASAAKAAIEKAGNKTDITTAQTNGTTAIKKDYEDAQLKSTKEAADDKLDQAGQDAKDAIGKMPDLTPDQITAFNGQIDAAVKDVKANIDGAVDATGVAQALQDGQNQIDNIQTAAQAESDATIDNEKAAADKVIADAAAATKAMINTMDPLSDKTNRLNQIDTDAQNAKAAIEKATNQTGITAAQNNGTATIATDLAAAQLKTTQEAVDADLVKYGQAAKDKIAVMPDLTKDQINQANAEIDAAVKDGQGQIDVAPDADGVAKALADGKANVDKVQETAQTNSDTTVTKEKNDANSVIDDAAAKAKAAIDAMNPLSDKADREAQVDRDAAAAKTAINSATNAADITKAQNNGTVALNTDTANAQLMSTKEAADAELTKYGQDAKDKIVAMSDLTNDQINQANSEIAAAVKAGQASIDAAAAANAVATALKNGEAAVNAVQTKSQSSSDAIVKTAKDAANSAIDDAAAKAKATIDALNPLSDKSDREAQLDKDAAAAKQKMAHDTTTEQVTVDQNSGLNAINNDVTAAQVKSAQEDATVRLRAYADNAEAAIAKLPDLPAADLADAKAKIESAVTAGNQTITAAQNVGDVKSALTVAEQTIDGVSATAQGQSNQVVSDAKQDAKNAIVDAAAKAKATIENLTPLSEDEKQAKEAHVDQDAKDATQNIDNATDTDAITQAKQTGINNINQDVLNSQIENVQRDAAARLLAYANQAKRTIVALPDLTKDQIDQANADIDAKVKTWTNNINQAQNLADVQTALVDDEKAIDDTSLTSQRQSQQTVTKEKNAANSVINDAAAKAKTAIDGLTPLSDKAAREAQIDMDAQNAKTAIAKATNKADIDTAQNAGTDTLNTDTAYAQLKSTKEAADAALAKYGQDAKDKIAAMPDLTPEQIKQANADIDATVKTGQANIDGAADAAGAAKALADGQANVDKVQATAQTNSDTTVEKEKAAANKIIDDAAVKAKAAVDGLTPLSDKAAREAQIDMDAQNAKAAIAKATNKADIDTAQKAGTDTLNTDTVAAQLKSQKEAADADLAKYGQSTKTTIQKLPDLTPDQVMKANGNIDDAVKKGQNQIDVATDADGVTTGLNNGKAAIDKIAADAASASSQAVAKARTQAKTAIDNAGGQAKATIDGLTALVDAQKGADQAKVDQDAATAKDKIDQATTTQAIKHALDDGLVTIQKDVENSILDNTKGEADSQLAGYAQTAKDKIVHLPNLTPEEIDQADREIDEIVAQGKKAIGQAAAENEVKVAVKTNKEKSDDVVANAQAESDWQKPVAKVAEPAPTPQPQSAPKQTPVLPMTSRLQKHHTDTTLLPLVALGLLTLFSGKRRRQHDDKK